MSHMHAEANFSLEFGGSVIFALKIPHVLLPLAIGKRDSFLPHLKEDTNSNNIPLIPVEVLSQFINHIDESAACNDHQDLLRILKAHLNDGIVGNNGNIHTLAGTELPGREAQQRKLIASYYQLAARTAGSTPSSSTDIPTSALLRAQASGEAKLFGLFGGQGNNKQYFDEFRAVWDMYEPLVGEFINTLSNTLKYLATANDDGEFGVVDQYPQGLDPIRWLRCPETTPDADYLITAPVSFPLIGLLQLAHVKAICMSLGLAPSDLGSMFAGLAGHSQGVIVAAALSACTSSSSSSGWEEDEAASLQASIKAVTILFAIGSRCQQAFSQDALSPEMAHKFETEYGYGEPSPMLSVSGGNLKQEQLEHLIDATNKRLPVEKWAYMALINSTSNFVVSGPERTLAALVHNIRAISASDPSSQARIPFTQRKPSPSIRFLPITIPCHCSLLDKAVELIEQDLERLGVTIPAQSLGIPVSQLPVHSIQGHSSIVPLLIRKITSQPVHWLDESKLFTTTTATHIIDFGPGLNSGVGLLTHRYLLGSGVRVIVAGKLSNTNPTNHATDQLGALSELFAPSLPPSILYPRSSSYTASHLPTLTLTHPSPSLNTPLINTPLTRLLHGRPPIFVAGMTPTTCSPHFVAAVVNAGYHAEFACGGYHSPATLRAALATLVALIPAGHPVAVNVIYVSPRQVAWQIPLLRQLRDNEGMPITGLTIGGGVPSLEVVREWVGALGLEWIGFKPGSVTGIRRVCEIARALVAGEGEGVKVMLQWTGGRGGGHHSGEDMFEPVRETYAEIRGCNNIVLVAGGGFGSAEDVKGWFDGTWALGDDRKGVRMPFDGVLMGSRVMATREARTSPGAKREIAKAEGVEDKEWTGTYKGVAGGVISVVSEMGERIHVVATRGARLWAEMDVAVFAVDKKKRGAVLAAKRAEIIRGLNADFQRPWFGRKSNGADDCDVADMTYEEVARRLVQLMFVGAEESNHGRWTDQSYAAFLRSFLERVEERLRHDGGQDSLVSREDCFSNPIKALENVLRACPLAASTLVYSEDVDYFYQLCRQPGQKPVPFIPALDDNFETWFKKDSLWQSEDVEAVVDQDAGRVFILHGPVAARDTCRVDEPVGEVLDGINQGVIDHLMCGIDVTSLPYEEMLCPRGGSKTRVPASPSNNVLADVSALSAEDLRVVLSRESAWKTAFLESRFIVRGRGIVENPVRKLFNPVSVSAVAASVQANSITLYADSGRTKPLVHISREENIIHVMAFTYTTRENEPISLALEFEYRPDTPYAPIREVMEGRNERICAMYRQLWQGEETGTTGKTTPSLGPEFTVFEDSFMVDAVRVRAFNRAVGYTKVHQHEKVPMDFAMVACWTPICKAILQDPIQGDVLNLVHLSNAYEVGEEGINPLQIGEDLKAGAFVNSITIEDSGKVVEVVCEVRRGDESPVALTVRSRFLFRGYYTDFSCTFARKTEPRFELHMSSTTDIAVLATKPWFRLDNQNGNTLDNLNLTDLTLEFHLETSARWLNKSTYARIDTTGRAYVRSEFGDLTALGSVEHRDFECQANTVLSYLTRWGQVVGSQQRHPVKVQGGPAPCERVFEVQTPASNDAYSRASGDFNPIHTSPLFAKLVSLPGTITHGMYCSVAVRQVVEKHAAGQNPNRIRSYHVSFVGMVLPGDVLDVSLCHSGMQAGLQVIDIAVTKQSTGDKVLTGFALIAQPSTTVVFTGQGSQEKCMGMDLYASSQVAKSIWDRADAYFQAQLGLSILDIVRNNPKEIKVHFGGIKGRMLRQNYLSMYYEVPSETPGGQPIRCPIFPSITQSTASYTHSSPSGLLFATQFAQPALTIMEMAAFKDMQARGVLDIDCHFAGHSLGEYAALLSITDFMPFENLLYFVFWRGMTMQSAVERDDYGRSAFAMVAVDPSRVGKGFSESSLRALVTQIHTETTFFLEIVNLNIHDRQYVCAGDLRALDLLQRACDALSQSPASPTAAPDQYFSLITSLATKYTTTTTTAAALTPPQSILALTRGSATVPLSGVDVPFHSSYLRPRIDAFRRTLNDILTKERLKPERLVGKYVPNVTGTPFELSREYVEDVWRVTGSERLRGEVLDRWEEWEARGKEARVGMVVDRGRGKVVVGTNTTPQPPQRPALYHTEPLVRSCLLPLSLAMEPA